jgi:hypothetical protein
MKKPNICELTFSQLKTVSLGHIADALAESEISSAFISLAVNLKNCSV